jgi:hypothetical protein
MRQQETLINERASRQARTCLSLIIQKNWPAIFGAAHSSFPKEALDKLSALTFDQVFLIHKFIETPQEILVEGMSKMPTESLKKYFRMVALQLHPDKNSHPLSKSAF